MSRNAKVKQFFKKNIFYILLGLSLLSVATIITLAVVLDKPVDPNLPSGGDTPIEDPDVPIVTEPLPFLLPVAANYTFGHTFTGEDGFIFSSTNGQYEAHFGLDFLVDAKTEVLASHDGEVISVEDDILDGLVVSIRHADNITTVYRTLDSDDVRVSVGDTVERGDVIGVVAEKTLYELKLGPHLHYEVWEGNVEVNPLDYFPELNK